MFILNWFSNVGCGRNGRKGGNFGKGFLSFWGKVLVYW